MITSYLSPKKAALNTAASFLLIWGVTARAYAVGNSINLTGPGSTNQITISDSSVCDVTNSNSLDLSNSVKQNAATGDVTADGNTTVGSGWSSWDPAVWKANGYSYNQWNAAFTAYEASLRLSLSTNWQPTGSGSGISTGNATNNNSANFDIRIVHGKVACSPAKSNSAPGSGGATIDTTEPGSTNAITRQTSAVLGAANMTALGVKNSAQQDAETGGVVLSGNTGVVGGAGSGPAENFNRSSVLGDITNNTPIVKTDPIVPPAAVPNSGSSIKTTGPNSNNLISSTTNSQMTITNKNDVSFANTIDQKSVSGNVSANNNTNVGGAGSGAAGNDSGLQSGVRIVN